MRRNVKSRFGDATKDCYECRVWFRFGVDRLGRVYDRSLIGMNSSNPQAVDHYTDCALISSPRGRFDIKGIGLIAPDQRGVVELDFVEVGGVNHVNSSNAKFDASQLYIPPDTNFAQGHFDVEWGCISETASIRIGAHALCKSNIITDVSGYFDGFILER